MSIVACADWLFWGHEPGISIAIFLALLAASIALANPAQASRRQTFIAAGLLAATLLPLVENAGMLSCLVSFLAAAHFALVAGTKFSGNPTSRLTASFGLLLAGPFRCCGSLILSLERKLHGGTARRMGTALVVWTVPTVCGAIFLLLFSAANPVIEGWFSDIRIDGLWALIDGGRLSFWLAMAALVGPFLFPRERPTALSVPGPDQREIIPLPEWIRGDAAVLRSLIVFNLLFAIQSALDIQYLWRGVALPQGMTFADYAHRGAYPLVMTAVLAGAFVILAMPPGSTRERSPVVRTLVFAWTVQNVLLVLSSMLRLKLYVETYSLTYLRTAAFIWMFLVAIGLLLVVGRIVLNRSNAWLVSMNLSALVLTLYLCGFVNFPSFVAMYNVTHSRELSGSGERLDIAYLAGLGPKAIPAIDRYAADRGAKMPLRLLQCRDKLAAAYVARTQDWHAWSFRGWWLARYLEKNPTAHK